MKITRLLFCIAVIGLFACLQASADTLVFSDGFEGYVAGPNPSVVLDQNYPSGPNAGVNGDLNGNPWVGQGTTSTTANSQAAKTWWGVNPYSGANLMVGYNKITPGNTFINLAYRIGGGQLVTGNLQIDWMVRDPNGKDQNNFCTDFVFLGNYNNVPGDLDFSSSTSIGARDASMRQCLGLGMMDAWGSGSADYGAYQARVYGPSAYRNYCTNLPHQSGVWNLPIRRTAAWHHMRIVVGPLLPDNTNTVAFFVDDMDHAGLVSNTQTPCGGYNVLNFITYNNFIKWAADATYSSHASAWCTAYYDDVSITSIDPSCTIDGVNNASIGALAVADGAYITAIGSSLPADTAYVQAPNGSGAVMIHYNNPNDVNITGVNADHYSGLSEMNLAVGTKICAMGKVQVTAAGEKYIEAFSVYAVQDPIYDTSGAVTGAAVTIIKQKPVGMNNLAAASELARGKFIKAWGVVSNVVADGFTISDGSNSPIKVYSGSIFKPTEGSYVSVCGAIGRDVNGLALYMNDDQNDLN